MKEREEGYYRVMFLDDHGHPKWEIAYYCNADSGGTWFRIGTSQWLEDGDIGEINEQKIDPMPGEGEEEVFRAGWLARNVFTTSDLSDAANEVLIQQDYEKWKKGEKNTKTK